MQQGLTWTLEINFSLWSDNSNVIRPNATSLCTYCRRVKLAQMQLVPSVWGMAWSSDYLQAELLSEDPSCDSPTGPVINSPLYINIMKLYL